VPCLRVFAIDPDNEVERFFPVRPQLKYENRHHAQTREDGSVSENVQARRLWKKDTGRNCDRFGDGTKVIYVYGEITYRDAFDDRWTMRYHYICGGLTDTKGLYVESIEETTDPSQARPHSEAPSSWFRRLKSLIPTVPHFDLSFGISRIRFVSNGLARCAHNF
jgi:hypothetical protein